jgi:hypothetical protein
MSISRFPLTYRAQSVFVLIVCALVFPGCAGPATPAPSNMAPMDIPRPGPGQETLPVPALPTAVYLPNAGTLDVSIWVPPYLAETLGGALEDPLRGLFVSDAALANIRLEVGEGNRVSQWVYALVTPFSSTLQGVSGDDLLSSWRGQTTDLDGDPPLLMDRKTYEMFSALWGPPGGTGVQVLAEQELLDTAWARQPALAIVPFEALEPRWKVLPVDGLSPVHRDFDRGSYRLTIPISLNSDPQLAALIKGNFVIPASNLDPQKMTIVAMTGVTALVRATASTMERRGVTYPAQDIRDWLLSADITHISNEVPFSVDCPLPNPVQVGVRFCSRDSYIQLLEDVGTDVVELTGDHFHDWGTEAMFHTLDLYRERGWLYYGGGADLADGRKALLIENHANRIAFIGCNAKGGFLRPGGPGEPGCRSLRSGLDGRGDQPPAGGGLACDRHLPAPRILHLCGPARPAAGLPPDGAGRGGHRQREPGAPAAGHGIHERLLHPLRPREPVLRPVWPV